MLDKAIEHGKEKRRKYYGSKSIDRSCRCHGSCSWCMDNRLFKHKKRELMDDEQVKNNIDPHTYNWTDEDYDMFWEAVCKKNREIEESHEAQEFLKNIMGD